MEHQKSTQISIQASKEAGINYSTAKSIVQNHRRKLKEEQERNNETDSCLSSKLDP